MDDYQDRGLKPRAIVLWKTDVGVPAGAAPGNIIGRQALRHDKMAEALAAFFANWMANRPLNICMNAFVHKALDGTILGIDRFWGMQNYKIYGCQDLTRNGP